MPQTLKLNMLFYQSTGETIDPMKIDDVTMLFSDLVGFTAICSSCTPLEVINMLNSLYTQFDHFCGVLDVYKVRSVPWWSPSPTPEITERAFSVTTLFHSGESREVVCCRKLPKMSSNSVFWQNVQFGNTLCLF